MHTNIKWFDVRIFVFHVWFELRLQVSLIKKTEKDTNYFKKKKKKPSNTNQVWTPFTLNCIPTTINDKI